MTNKIIYNYTMELLPTNKKNKVLQSMIRLLDEMRDLILEANQKDLDAFERDDQALYDRLVVDSAKVDDMIRSVREVEAQDDPVGKIKYERTLDTGLRVINKTAPFGDRKSTRLNSSHVAISYAVFRLKKKK